MKLFLLKKNNKNKILILKAVNSFDVDLFKMNDLKIIEAYIFSCL